MPGWSSMATSLSETEEIFTKVRVGFLFANPFLSVLAMSLQTIYSDEHESLFATDGASIYINPGRVAMYAPEEITYKYAHTILHIALKHPKRREARDHKLWNLASNIAVNNLMLDFKSVGQLPEDEFTDERFLESSVEEIYSILDQEEAQGGEIKESDKDLIEAEPKEIEGKILIQAMATAKGKNTLPVRLIREIEELHVPELPVEDILEDYLVMSLLDRDYSYKRPNKRFQDIYLPSTAYTMDAIKLIIAVDSSSSIDLESYKKFLGIIERLTQNFLQFNIKIIPFNEKVEKELITDIDSFAGYDPRDIFIDKSEGGTSFVAVLEYLKTININEYKVCIVLTDGLFELTQTPFIETLFLVTQKRNIERLAQYGRAVRFKL